VDIALVQLGTKSVDSVLAAVMFIGTGLAAATLFFFMGRHQHRKRKARKHAERGSADEPPARR
jgi:hypothetical protein